MNRWLVRHHMSNRESASVCAREVESVTRGKVGQTAGHDHRILWLFRYIHSGAAADSTYRRCVSIGACRTTYTLQPSSHEHEQLLYRDILDIGRASDRGAMTHSEVP